MDTITYLFIIVLLALFTGYTSALYLTEKRKLSQFRFKSGITSLWPGCNGKLKRYELISYDGGGLWYAVKFHANRHMEILGEADAVIPGLRSHLNKIDQLAFKQRARGPLSFFGVVNGVCGDLSQRLVGFTVMDNLILKVA